MVLVLDGNLEHVAHMWRRTEVCYENEFRIGYCCLSKLVPDFTLICTPVLELTPNISTKDKQYALPEVLLLPDPGELDDRQLVLVAHAQRWKYNVDICLQAKRDIQKEIEGDKDEIVHCMSR